MIWQHRAVPAPQLSQGGFDPAPGNRTDSAFPRSPPSEAIRMPSRKPIRSIAQYIKEAIRVRVSFGSPNHPEIIGRVIVIHRNRKTDDLTGSQIPDHGSLDAIPRITLLVEWRNLQLDHADKGNFSSYPTTALPIVNISLLGNHGSPTCISYNVLATDEPGVVGLRGGPKPRSRQWTCYLPLGDTPS